MSVYVMSDVHGCKDRFCEMLQCIGFQAEDTLYVLGDVIDRGTDGIALLQQIRSTSNMILFMGNHEHMMLEAYDAYAQLKKGYHVREAMTIIIRWEYNHNTFTREACSKLSKAEKKDLLDYLRLLPLAYPDVKVAGRHYYLAHANWHPQFMSEPFGIRECNEQGIDPSHFIWERIDHSAPLPKDRTLIFGHTVTSYYHPATPCEIYAYPSSLTKAKMIAIDCGCSSSAIQGRLACIRLDDMEVYYV